MLCVGDLLHFAGPYADKQYSPSCLRAACYEFQPPSNLTPLQNLRPDDMPSNAVATHVTSRLLLKDL